MEMLELLKFLINVYLFVSPFVILFLYNKVKSLSDIHNLIKLLDTDVLKVTEVDEDYAKLIDAYGSISGYEDAMLKDFETMRNYLVKVKSTLDIAVSMLNSFNKGLKTVDADDISPKVVVKILSNEVDKLSNDFELCSINLNNFIESEREAHESPHSAEDIKEKRRNKNER